MAAQNFVWAMGGLPLVEEGLEDELDLADDPDRLLGIICAKELRGF